MSYSMPLVGMIRVKNGGKYIKYPLDQMEKMKVLGKIVVFDDHSTDDTIEICRRYDKVTIVHSPFEEDDKNEWRDRNFILNKAKEFNSSWILSLDADEVFEDRIHELIEPMVLNDNPQVLQYVFPLLHLWDMPGDSPEESGTWWRSDGLWGSFTQARMFKNLPNQEIPKVEDDSNLSGCCPWFDNFNTRMILCRIKHYGNIDAETRGKKYEFYSKIYKEKGVSKLALGAWEDHYKKLYGKEVLDPEDYIRHILDEHTVRHKWIDRVSITLNVIMKNNEEEIARLIDATRFICDDAVVVDTGSTDNSKQVAESLGAKVVDFPWNHSFADARNKCIEHTKGSHILRLDTDETVEKKDLLRIWWMANAGEIDGYVFPVKNWKEDPGKVENAKWFHSQTIRMFRPHPKVKYEGLVHEEIMRAFTQENLGRRPILSISPVCVQHYGYLKPETVLERKYDYYYRLCLKQIEVTPDDFYMYQSIGTHFNHIGLKDRAIFNIKKSIELKPDNFIGYLVLGGIYLDKKLWDLAIENYKKVIEIESPLKSDSLVDMAKRSVIECRLQKEAEMIKKEMCLGEENNV